MKKSLISAILLFLGVMLIIFSNIFEKEQKRVESINKEHLQNIQKIAEIERINDYIEKSIKPILSQKHHSVEEGIENLALFFDANSQKFGLSIDKYIYDTEISKNMTLSYKIMRQDKDKIDSLLRANYKSGFLDLSEFKMDKNSLIGKMELIQPYKKDMNVSK